MARASLLFPVLVTGLHCGDIGSAAHALVLGISSRSS